MHFLHLASCEAFSLQKVVEMLEKVVVSWREVRWIWQMRQNFIAQFVQLLKQWLCNVWLGIISEKNWALSVDQCWLQALQFLVHLIDWLSIHLRRNGFTSIQKAEVDQTGSTPPNSGHDPIFGANLTLGSTLKFLLGPSTDLVITGCHIKSTCPHTSDWEIVCRCCIE